MHSMTLIIVEMSDERTIREDLIIRENSSPDVRRGTCQQEKKSSFFYRNEFVSRCYG